ncbi:MAG: NAD(P)H-dependent oxidoreductase [candidate division FCPU426 bacterium]
MRILLILAHPEPKSLNHAIARRVMETLKKLGHSILLHDLYAEQFPCVMSGSEIAGRNPVDSVIENHCCDLQNAQGLVIIHPNWWGQPPAILKGWVDRVFRSGVAYRFLPGDQGEGIPEGLLGIEKALILNTSDTPREREISNMGDPLEAIWKKCILEYCGIKQVTRRMFGVVITSTFEEREKWLKETEELVVATYPAEPTAG